MNSKVALMKSQVDFSDCKLLYLNAHENYGKD
jgi:hypothetical protein